jgi:GT2 family glycosyltransferase
MNRVAVLLTCYNRKDKTLNCLRAFYNAVEYFKSKDNFEIYLVDDNSSDGTKEAVRNNFPEVNIIIGTGHLFWAGGMRLAWNTAIEDGEFQAYLLLNDDTELLETTIRDLIQTHQYSLENYKKGGVYIGSTVDPITNNFTYGGRKIYQNGLVVKSGLVNPTNQPVECDFANANILWVSREVVNQIGIFNENYTHSLADFDYTFTAKKNNFPVLVAPGIGGYCIDDHGNNWLSSSATLKERIKFLYSPKGLSYKEYLYYIKRNFPLSYMYVFTVLWLKTLFPFIWDRFKKKQ